MHTDSSASLTYLASRSASECTATVLIPISRQARWIRKAISPRLAIRTFSNIATPLADDEKGFAVFYRLAAFHQDGLDYASLIRFDFIQQLHGFDDAESVACGNSGTHFNERIGVWRRGAVEGTNHGRFHHMAFNLGCDRLAQRHSRARSSLRRGHHMHGLHILHSCVHGLHVPTDTDFFFTFGQFQFGYAGPLDQVDQFFKFA